MSVLNSKLALYITKQKHIVAFKAMISLRHVTKFINTKHVYHYTCSNFQSSKTINSSLTFFYSFFTSQCSCPHTTSIHLNSHEHFPVHLNHAHSHKNANPTYEHLPVYSHHSHSYNCSNSKYEHIPMH